jgi:phage N-6-adenine-methyltransferase
MSGEIVPVASLPGAGAPREGKSQNVQVGAPGRQDYETPDAFFELCDREFNFGWDLAAHADNHKCPRWFGPGSPYAADSLLTPWWDLREWSWLNPPFADIKPWARKCLEESERGARIAMLTLASTGANWFRDYCWNHCDIRFLNGRLKFKGATGPFPKDLALYVFDASKISGVQIWDWRKAA